MPHYEYRAKFPVAAGGNHYAAGAVIATIITDIPVHQIVTSLNACECVEVEPPKSAKQPVAKPVETVAQPAADASKPVYAEPETSATVIDISGYPGLAKNLAEPLVAAGYKDVEAINDAIDGDLDLLDLKGIGKASKGHILKYLAELDNPPPTDDGEGEAEE